MQELRFVLIIVGALAIAALLVHGLWTSKKEGKAKFGDKPLGKLDVQSSPEEPEADDDYEIVRKGSRTNDFVANIQTSDIDPLIDSVTEPVRADNSFSKSAEFNQPVSEDDLPRFSSLDDDIVEPTMNTVIDETDDVPASLIDISESVEPVDMAVAELQQVPIVENTVEPEPELEVIVLNVHTSQADQPFIGTKLFDSMQQNGLLYGEMDIFHRHADLSGTDKVLFSVANMMQPGTLQHNDPADFSTMGISFFMTLPCFGDAEQNFKLMLKTAQQIADDLGGEVQDDGRKMMTPTRLDLYRKQIQDFKARKTA
ncbi:cell division protein ZipA [Vibrio sp. FNV 38]|nr:cell division protein ZipA [Vibrio sp. FNV 38]